MELANYKVLSGSYIRLLLMYNKEKNPIKNVLQMLEVQNCNAERLIASYLYLFISIVKGSNLHILYYIIDPGLV